ncbi:PIN-like domain-containing protein [Dactylosporangium sp. CA-139066]|uniref:PIN-like domain-containing protein n=1 Tax=Dactylosporangium sp. CA-139066 TaxID=3239930 RepID=UPI003D8E5B05
MTDGAPTSPNTATGLASGFEAWWKPYPDPADYVRSALVVLDANALLHLYRVTPTARDQILVVLDELRQRLWIPHQAALEFHRNRIEVVSSRTSQLRELKQALREAPRKAIAELRRVTARLEGLRLTYMSQREWSSERHGLDEPALAARLAGVVDGALAELAELESEHDLRLGGIQAGDQVLDRLEGITRGRIGKPYDSSALRALVEEAVNFRFPSLMPPGYKDLQNKPTAYRAAGDYILWRQVLDRAAETAVKSVVLVTNDVKEDWWTLDKNGAALHVRPELRQEMAEVAKAELALLTLSSFLEAASAVLPGKVSSETVSEVRASEGELQLARLVSWLTPHSGSDPIQAFSALDHRQFEHLVGHLLAAMGFVIFDDLSDHLGSFDFVVVNPDGPDGSQGTAVNVRYQRSPVASLVIQAHYGAMIAAGIRHGMIVTSAKFTQAAIKFAKGKSIELIDGSALLNLLGQYFDAGAASVPESQAGSEEEGDAEGVEPE